VSLAITFDQFDLPWTIGRDEARRFQRLLTICLGLVLVFGVVIPLVQLPEVEREKLDELPPQLARIVLEKPEPVVPPPPPPPEMKVEPKPIPEPKVEQKVVPKPVEKPIPQPTVADAREKAALSGILAFKDSFADLRDAVDVEKLSDTGTITRGSGDAATIDRSLLTSKRGGRSAGVNVAALSRDVGGVALSGRETTKVEAPAGAKGTGGNRKVANATQDPRMRSIEEIRRVFDGNKGAIFAIYNRALRQDPSLKGQVVLELVIDPAGRVLECRVVSSEIGDGEMVAKVVNRIRLFDFGKRDVGTTTISYPVHFLPT
jgi:outer membrane biosynthesis protein TonB